MDTGRVLRPLDDRAIDQLDEYESPEQLAEAVQAAAAAVEKTLRNLLRFDPGGTDDQKLAARSPTELPHDQLIPALRQRELISLRLAGQVHELDLASKRAARGEVRPDDADHAYEVIRQLKLEVGARADQADRPGLQAAIETGTLIDATTPAAKVSRRPRLSRRAVYGLGALVLVAIALFIFTRDSALQKGINAFQAERWSVAEQHLRKAAEDKDDATAQLYLARVYRREQAFDRAAEVLKEAATRHPDDADLARELGNLFMDLNQPQLAIQRYRKAQELDPEEKLNWIGLIRALREARDPSAEQVLQQAPAEVRAALTRTN
jgi:tetratricopeptide (TPR) repeat protein